MFDLNANIFSIISVNFNVNAVDIWKFFFSFFFFFFFLLLLLKPDDVRIN